jgi:hypothetical protein
MLALRGSPHEDPLIGIPGIREGDYVRRDEMRADERRRWVSLSLIHMGERQLQPQKERE